MEVQFYVDIEVLLEYFEIVFHEDTVMIDGPFFIVSNCNQNRAW